MATAKNLWVPAVNNDGGLGRWAFVEITDPWDAQNLIRAFMVNLSGKQPPPKASLLNAASCYNVIHSYTIWEAPK